MYFAALDPARYFPGLIFGEIFICSETAFAYNINRLIVKWRHLVVTFSIEEFSIISENKSFLLQCSDLA